MRIGLPEAASVCKVSMPLFGNLVHLLLQFFYTHELLTLFVALLVEEAGIPIPIPGDALLMLAGAESHKTVWSGVADIVVCSVAVFLGSSLLLRVMRRGGRALLLKYGKFVHLSPHALGRLERWFLRRGRLTIIVGRLIPGLRIPTTVTAGISGIPFTSYLTTATIAAPFWSTVIFFVGAMLGSQGPRLIGKVAGLVATAPGWLLVLSALLLLGGAGSSVLTLLRHRRYQHAAI